MERHFHEEFKALKQRLVQMGLLVEAAIEKAVDALFNRSVELANKIYEDERVINQMEIEIDEKGHNLLALAQPLAGDLRLITMILKINTDLERMGDHAVNIAEKSFEAIKNPGLEIEFYIREIAVQTQKMLRDSLDCFMKEDSELARCVLWSDDQVDLLNDRLYSDIGELMQKKPAVVRAAISVIMIGHNLERIADLANNIAENVIYLKQGREVRHHIENPGPAD